MHKISLLHNCIFDRSVIPPVCKVVAVRTYFSLGVKQGEVMYRLIVSVCILLAAWSCSNNSNDTAVLYAGESGSSVKAVYHNPPDQPRGSVTLTLADGTKITLPQTMAASGVRYSDETTLVWWTKGGGAFMERPDQSGEWQIVENYTEKP